MAVSESSGQTIARRGARISLRVSLVGISLLTVALTAAAVHFPWFWVSRDNVTEMSRQLTTEIVAGVDREVDAIFTSAIAAQSTEHVLVTHGTDSMVQTGQVLKSIAGKTIVMTGALSPARFRGSDAEFNIGCAIGAVQSLPHGVYIAMNGLIWDPANVRKNVAATRFEAT